MSDKTREEYHREMQKLRVVEKPKPVRLSLSDILALMLTRGGGERDTVSLTRNAKGVVQPEVTIRTREGETILDAEREAREVFDRLCQAYPYPNGETD